MRSAIIGAFLALTAACTRPPQPPPAVSPSAAHFVAPAEAHRLVEKEGALLLDVRTPQEFAAGHIAGAVNIPVQELPQRLDDVAGAHRIVVYCHSGRRAAKAAELLKEKGHEVANLGPMTAWESK